jgi:hypothetical protein
MTRQGRRLIGLSCAALALALAAAGPATAVQARTSAMTSHHVVICSHARRVLRRAHTKKARRKANAALERCIKRYRHLHPPVKEKPPVVVTPPVVTPPVTPPVVPPPPPPPPPGGPAGATVFYDDAFTGSAPASFWNESSSSGVSVANGQATIAAGGHYLGAHLPTSQAGFQRDLVLHVVSGDGPGVTLYNYDTGGEVLDFSAHAGVFTVQVDGVDGVNTTDAWSYPLSNTWWRIHTDGMKVSIETSSDASTWTLAGTHTAALAGGLNLARITAAGNGIGHGASTQPTVVDHLTWWDDALDNAPVATSLTSGVLDDGQRADENPLSDGGNWITPGFPDHVAMELLSNKFVGTGNNGVALWDTSFGPGTEAWATVGAPANDTTEYTLFTAMQPNAVPPATSTFQYRAGYDCWTQGAKLWIGRFDLNFSFYYLVPGIPLSGGALVAGDKLGLVAKDSIVSVAVKRAGSGSWQRVAQAYDPAYTSGYNGYALIDHNGVVGSWSALGGGTTAP